MLLKQQHCERARKRSTSHRPLRQCAPAASLARVLRAGCEIVGDDGGRGATLSFIRVSTNSCRTVHNIVCLRRDLSRGDGERGQHGGGGTAGAGRPRRARSRCSGFHFSTTGLWTAHQDEQRSASRRKRLCIRPGD